MNQAPRGDSKSETDLFREVKEMVRPCLQCGTCTGSCPNQAAMDFSPRLLWRMILCDELDEVLNSRTFSLCSSCYCCTLRCPRGLPLTQAMFALKRIGFLKNPKSFRSSRDFYRHFLDSIRRHGRAREMEIMTLYLFSRMSPSLSWRFAPLGWRLMSRGKVSLGGGVRTNLEGLFRKAAELEAE